MCGRASPWWKVVGVKKLINDPYDVVRESLEGLALSQPGLVLLDGRTIAVRADRVIASAAWPQGADPASVPVALISGGGAGHEPAHAGYVAPGMLTAAVLGAVFSSPGVDAVLDAIRTVTGDAGCLLIVKSYTGDRLNFGLAAELARADGLAVELVVVADDVALADPDGRSGRADLAAGAGRRGLAGTVLVHKMAGALAETGAPLAQVADRARTVAGLVGTMAVGLSAGTVPAAGEPGFHLDDDEVEMGLGIHGEPGVRRQRLRPADDLAAELVSRIVEDRGLADGARVVALIGSAGATPPMELAIMARGVAAELNRRKIIVERLYQGLVMTSLDMAGVSVTLLELPGDDQELLAALDEPTGSLAWPGHNLMVRPTVHRMPAPESPPAVSPPGTVDHDVRAAIDAACRALVAAENELTGLDQVVGDGDLGAALARGANAWLDHPVVGSAGYLLRSLAAIAQRAVGGTSGPLYAVGLLRAGLALDEGARWPDAFVAGVRAVGELGGAGVGDRTMLDALVPAAEAGVAAENPLPAAVAAAQAGADATADLVARRGRSSYLGDRVRGHRDPGAVAVTIWLRALGT